MSTTPFTFNNLIDRCTNAELALSLVAAVLDMPPPADPLATVDAVRSLARDRAAVTKRAAALDNSLAEAAAEIERLRERLEACQREAMYADDVYLRGDDALESAYYVGVEAGLDVAP